MSEETVKQEGLSSAEKLWRIRHSCAHIMAQAVQEMFPEARFAIGPPIADGFYYDFDLPRALTPEDLEQIEERMTRIVKGNFEFKTWSAPRDEAIGYFESRDQPYKVELIRDLPDDEVRFYQQDAFTDLCAGPHVRRTGECKAFKLLKVAGAYWRGDSNRPMLQRIYGTAWRNRADLDTHLHLLEEAKKRDHRKLGRELDLFSFHQESPGAIFWHPKGWTVYRELQRLSREMHFAAGYVEISNPIIYNKSLYETSGHWEHYRESMFLLESEGDTYCVKPMNCPDTMLYFRTRKHSYRELPLRVYEGQLLHRNELSGALNGLLRVRQFCQDDAHIFATEDQIESEIRNVIALIDRLYSMLQLRYRVKLSTRPEKFLGEVEMWDRAEAALARAIEANGLEYVVNKGDGAFYGPKIDFDVVDALGRKWQCATIQLDFQLPRRFELTYTDSDNTQKTPVVIHRALFGSIERFFGILLEHVAGAYPTWLAPVQAIFLPINDDLIPYCEEAVAKLRARGIRAEVDHRSEKLGYKIREAEIHKVPYMLVAGKKEVENGTFALRTYRKGDRGAITADALIEEMVRVINDREFDVDLQVIQWSSEDDDEAVATPTTY